jgi:hypothetical protein
MPRLHLSMTHRTGRDLSTQPAAGLDGHAWVEADGLPVGEDPAFLSPFAVCETS